MIINFKAYWYEHVILSYMTFAGKQLVCVGEVFCGASNEIYSNKLNFIECMASFHF